MVLCLGNTLGGIWGTTWIAGIGMCVSCKQASILPTELSFQFQLVFFMLSEIAFDKSISVFFQVSNRYNYLLTVKLMGPERLYCSQGTSLVKHDVEQGVPPECSLSTETGSNKSLELPGMAQKTKKK